VCIAVYGNPSENYGVSPAVWDHTDLTGVRLPFQLQSSRLWLLLDLLALTGWNAGGCLYTEIEFYSITTRSYQKLNSQLFDCKPIVLTATACCDKQSEVCAE